MKRTSRKAKRASRKRTSRKRASRRNPIFLPRPNRRRTSRTPRRNSVSVPAWAPATAFNVYLRGKLIDTVFQSGKTSAAEVKKSLVDHDGYEWDIKVVKRKTARASKGLKQHRQVRNSRKRTSRRNAASYPYGKRKMFPGAFGPGVRVEAGLTSRYTLGHRPMKGKIIEMDPSDRHRALVKWADGVQEWVRTGSLNMVKQVIRRNARRTSRRKHRSR